MKVIAFGTLVILLFSGCFQPPARTPTAFETSRPDGSTAIATPESSGAQGPPEQTGSIQGRVADDELNPIPNATIHIPSLKVDLSVAMNGTFVIGSVPTGHYEVIAEASGYIPQARKVEVRPGQATTVSLTLMSVQEIDVAYHVSIPREFYMDIANSALDATVDTLQRQGAPLNRSAYCTKCQGRIYYDPRPVQWIGEATWQGGGVGVNQRVTMQWATLTKGVDCADCVKTFQFQGIVTNNGKWEASATNTKWVHDGNGTTAWHNVTNPEIGFQHRLTTWTSLAYVEPLGRDFSALPRP